MHNDILMRFENTQLRKDAPAMNASKVANCLNKMNRIIWQALHICMRIARTAVYV